LHRPPGVEAIETGLHGLAGDGTRHALWRDSSRRLEPSWVRDFVGDNSSEDASVALARLREHLSVVSDAARTFAEATTDYERLLDSVARTLCARVGDGCAVFLLDEAGVALRFVSLQAVDPRAVEPMRQLFAAGPLLLEREPALSRVLATGQALLVEKLDHDSLRKHTASELAALEKEMGLHSVLFVALRASERNIGVVGLGRFRVDSPPYTARDQELAQTLADHASLAIQNGRLYVALQKARRAAQEAEERARRSEQTHRFFFESSPIPTFAFDVESSHILEGNAAALALYGYTHDEFVALRLDDLRAPEERAALARAVSAAGDAPMQSSALHVRKDGSTIIVEGRNHLITLDGRRARLVVVQDQTERVKAESARRDVEERLQRTLDMMMEGYTIVGHDLRYLYVNEVGARHAHLTKEQLLGRSPLELYPDFEKTGMYALLQRCLKERVPLRMEEGMTLPDGQQAFFEVNIRPIPEGLVILSIDVTERRRTEEARESLEEQLRQSQRMDAVGRLAGGIAHDFNNILSIILGYGETLLEDLHAGDPKRADVLEMHKAAGRAAELTRQLLMFSRQQMVEPKILDMNEVIGGMQNMLRRLLGEHIELGVELEPHIGRVRADRGNIEQVIMNLVVNARDAMPRGGKLSVSTANVSVDDAFMSTHAGAERGAYVRLSVADTGIGMEKATRLRIFEPFFTTKEQGKGTGLGLSTVFGIVKQSHGGVWVHSEPGHGSTFEVYLPRTDADVESSRISQRVVEGPGSETILLVEDEEAVRTMAQRMLERNGYRVIVARDPADALRIASEPERRIDLLLTDVVMPVMSGAALATQLRQLRPELEVLYVSGYTDGTVGAHGVLETGAFFLQKPFTSEQLIRKLRSVLDAPPGAPPGGPRPSRDEYAGDGNIAPPSYARRYPH
jgi:two-component system, cell cycle sensor histidine kinase and response regulator CckA